MHIENTNKKHKALITVVISALILTTLSFVNSGFELFGIEFRNVNILSDLTKKPKKDINTIEIDTAALTKIDSVDQALIDSLKRVDSIREAMRADTLINDYSPDSIHSMGRFFRALHRAKTKGGKVRIAYFGDSMIEGDLITQNLRSSLQAMFGGKGVGFVPITSIVAGFRRTIKHTFSDNWESYTILEPNDSINYGVAGFVFRPYYIPGIYQYDTTFVENDSLPTDTIIKITKLSQEQPKEEDLSWVTYETPKGSFSGVRNFSNLKLYYGPAKTGNSVEITTNGETKKLVLRGSRKVNEIQLYKGEAIHDLTLKFKADTAWDIYGISSESNGGIQLDNYALRGNSGLGLTAIKGSTYRQFNKFMHYDLIVLQFGLNVSDAKVEEYGWYTRGMKRVIKHLQRSVPTADILLIGVGDRSHKNEEGEFETQPNIPILVEAQRRAAQQAEVAFWNLYQAMGGHNSMVEWVEAEEPMANKDYTHVNHKGARKISDMLKGHLMREYNKYLKKAKLDN